MTLECLGNVQPDGTRLNENRSARKSLHGTIEETAPVKDIVDEQITGPGAVLRSKVRISPYICGKILSRSGSGCREDAQSVANVGHRSAHSPGHIADREFLVHRQAAGKATGKRQPRA